MILRKIKSVLIPLFTLVLFSSLLFLSACEDDEPESDCSECQDDAPFSTPSSNTCYETLSECESAESGNCQRCNWSLL